MAPDGTTDGTATTGNGSSSGAGSSMVRFVNAAPSVGPARSPIPSALDLCVKLDSDTAYGASVSLAPGTVKRTVAAQLIAIPQGSVDLRVVAAGGDCGTTLFDLRIAARHERWRHLAVVAYGDETTKVNGVSVVETTAPTPCLTERSCQLGSRAQR